MTARFMEFCNNCGYQLWPDGPTATAAFRQWQAADPGRRNASRFDLTIPDRSAENDPGFDYDARARQLGIHMFPTRSNSPFPIAVGLGFILLANIPFPVAIRWIFGLLGLVIFLYGVGLWVFVEDVKLYPADDEDGSGAGHGSHPEEAIH